MTRALLFLALALAGAAAWLLSSAGGGPAGAGVPGEEEPGGAPAPPPAPAGRGRESIPLPGERPAPSPPGPVLEVQVAAAGGPVAGASLTMSAGAVEAVTDAAGRARVAFLPRGELLVDHPDHLPWQARLPAAPPPLLTIRLIRAAVVRGRVLSPDGRPGAGARIQGPPPPAGPDGQAPRGAGPLAATAGPDGAYRLTRLPPGRLEIACILGQEARQVAVTLAEGEERLLDFDFAPTGPLVDGFLLDLRELPLEGWWVVAEEEGPGGARASMRVGAEGGFRLQLPRPGRAAFLAGPADEARGVWLLLGSFEIPPRGLAGLRLRLGALEIHGALTVEGGEPLPERPVVTAWREEGEGLVPAARTGTLGPNGTFRLAGLAPGLYRMGITAPGYPDLMAWLGPLAGGVHDAGTLLLTRQGTGEILLISQGKGSEPPPAYQVWRREGDLLLPLELLPAGEGRLLARQVPAGEWRLRIEAEGFVPGEPEVAVRAGGQFRLTLEFVRGHPLTVAVEIPPDRVLETLLARLGGGGPELRAVAAGPGLWTFPALPAGELDLLVGASGYWPERIRVVLPARETPAARIRLRPR